MKSDTQHLDFLISQYVDGALDPASKKSLEQTMLSNPQARGLYKEHRDVQDMLDDWGNRIPMIDWDSFDRKLGERLEQETVGSERPSIFRRWARPLSIAAGLFVAATIGYTWHAWTAPQTVVIQPEVVAQSPNVGKPLEVERPAEKVPGHRSFEINETLQASAPGTVEVIVPEEPSGVPANQLKPGAVTIDLVPAKSTDKDQPADPTPQFPYP